MKRSAPKLLRRLTVAGLVIGLAALAQADGGKPGEGKRKRAKDAPAQQSRMAKRRGRPHRARSCKRKSKAKAASLELFVTSSGAPLPRRAAPDEAPLLVLAPAARPIDGSGNDLSTPDEGKAGAQLLRALTPDYADGVAQPAGPTRPSTRAISNAVHAQTGSRLSHRRASDILWVWGQFLDHDLTLSPEHHPSEAFPIPVPAGDPWFDPTGSGQATIPLSRSIYAPGVTPRQQLNAITAWIDGSNVYGSDAVRAAALRTQDGTGRLRTTAGDLLPRNTGGLDNAPTAHDPSLFLAGDVRANEHVALTSMHTLFVREHNRLAGLLRARFPQATGEQLYQAARRIVTAELQAITYQEFLPVLLGPKGLSPYGGYRQQAQVGILNAFSTAAFRFGHSLLSPRLDRLDAQLAPIAAGPLRLQDGFFQPARLNQGGIEPILRGAAHQVCQELDPLLTDGVRNFLFGPPGSGGLDLASLNLQRGRDHGLPGYNAARRLLGLAPRASLAEVTADPRRAARLASVYADVEQLDLWTGALSEDPLPGALVGELLGLLIKRQFELLRDGDRFHYEHAFSGAALTALRETRLVDVIRRNTSIGNELPDDVFTGRLLPFTPNDLTVRAVTADGETAARFTGFVTIRTSTGEAPLDGLVVELTRADRGEVRLPDVALFQALGEVTLTATSLGKHPVTGSLTLQVALQDPVVYPAPPTTLAPGGAHDLRGVAYPGATVELIVDDGTGPVVLATTTAGADGAYAFDLALPAGTHALTIRTTDPASGAVYQSDTYTTTVLPKTAQRLVAAFGETFTPSGWQARTVTPPATSGAWFLTVVRSRTSAHARVELDGQELVDARSWLVGQERLRLRVPVQASSALRVRVVGRGSVEVRLDGVVPELDLPSGVGRRVAELTPFEAQVAGAIPARTEAFTVALPNAPEGLFSLAATNGAPPPLASRVEWNGVEVLAPLGLLFQGSRLLPLNDGELQASNTLTARVLGRPASRLGLRLEAYLVDEQPPQIAIAPPEDAVVGPDDLIVVTVSDAGSGPDHSATRIELNGADVTTQFVRSGATLEARAGDLPLLPVNVLAVTAQDLACNPAQAERRFRIVAPGPAVVHPAALQVECGGPGGTVVRFTVRASDPSDPDPVVSCSPASGASFPLGTTTVTCVATTADGRTTTVGFPVTVVDTTPPLLGAPAPALRAAVALPGSATAAVGLADVSGDGALDLLAAEPATGRVVLRTGDGRGGFGPSQALVVGADPRALLLADLDGDGDRDLIVANTATSTITRLLNDGAGDFGAPVSTPAGASPTALAAADFDADGRLDVAVACGGADSVVVLFGDGAGGFPRQATLATVGQPAALLATDHDVDGRPDLAVAGAGGVWLHLGLGAGGFEPARTVSLAGARALASGDIDDDGWRDLAAVSPAGVTLLRNDGQRGLTAGAPLALPAAASAVLALDLEGDGDADLVAGGSLLLNQGGGAFGAPTPLGWSPAGLAAGDVDADGRPDLAAALTTGAALRRGDPAQADLFAEATGPGGAAVTYATPAARDRCDATPTVACAPTSGSTFPLGTTEVTCTATDASGNVARLRFQVVVRDTTPPALTPPADLVVEQTGPTGAVVTYAAPVATDAVDPAPSVVCTPASGSLFPAGTTTVTCTATDAAGNQASASFTVTVRDTTPPALTQPADLVVEQTSPAGSTVFYTAPTATDAVDPSPSVVCAPASGSVFAPGTTTVTCTATDAAGNAGSVSFTVTVRDTVAPSLTLAPADGTTTGAQPSLVATYADSGAGVDLSSFAATLDGNDISASFTVGPGSAQATPAPLAAGSHTLTVTLRDSAGNQASATTTFTVVLADTTAPTLTIDSPAEGACTGPQSLIQVSYADTQSGVDTGSLAITLNSQDVTSSFTMTATGASARIADLPAAAVLEGSNALSVSVSDVAGNAASASVGFDVDRIPPVVTLTPANGATVAGGSVALIVSYVDAGCGGIDPGRFSATLDGQTITSDFLIGPSAATASKTLAAGSHTLSVTLRDLVGNEVTVSSTFTIVFPATALAVSLEDAQGQAVDPADVPLATELTVVVRAVDAGGQTVTGFVGLVQLTASDGQVPLDGLVGEITAADQGVLRLPNLALFRTLGLVTLGARSLEPPPADVAGTLGLTVTLDQPLLFPEPPAQVGADGSLTLEGYSFPGQAVELLVDGQVVDTVVAGPTGEYRFALLLQPGSRQVAVRADDGGGTPVTSQTFTVVVPLPTVAALRLEPASLSLAAGQALDLRLFQQLSTGVEEQVASGASFQTSAAGVATVDAATGRVTAVAPGTATITASFAGQTTTAQVVVTGAALVTSSPVAGEGEVAISRETILRFSAPLAVASVTSDAVYAEFGGQRLRNRLHVSPDAKTVTVFYDDPLPASARVRVTVAGDQLLAAAGGAIDADQDGVPGGTALIDFDTLSLSVVPGTAVCGRVFAAEPVMGPSGPINQPLAGVTIRVDGSSLTAVTDQNGSYRLDPSPAGKFFVHIDGKTSTAPVPAGAYYPTVGKAFEAPVGVETNMPDIFLPLVAADALSPVSTTQDTTVTFSATVLAERPELAGLEITVPADSLYADDGTRGGQVGIAPVPPDRLPGPLPEDLQLPLVITVQTDGASNFDTPVPVKFPNLEGLPPGAKTALWSFNHDTGQWEVVGSMTISADGLWAVSDPGTGIRAPGWHGVREGILAWLGELFGFGGGNRPRLQAAADQGGANGTGGSSHSNDRHKKECNITLHNGEEYFTVTDLAIPGRGQLHFNLTRRYRSRVLYNGPLGHNWDFNYNEGLFLEPNGDVVRVDGFGHRAVWARTAAGTYQTPVGFYGTLVKEPGGDFVLRQPDGLQRIYFQSGRLKAYRDRQGNTMLFDYDDEGDLDFVIDVYGREIDFVFEVGVDGVKRLASVRDFLGRTVRYTYDGQGDLVAVRSPLVIGTSTGNDFPMGRTERYTYSSGFADPRLNHNILTRTLPEEVATGGTPAFVWAYGTDPALPSFDRVTTRTRGGTNATGVSAGGMMSLSYQILNAGTPLGDLTVPRLLVTDTDRNGNVTEHYFNEAHHGLMTRELTRGLRVGEPTYFETRETYNSDGLLERVIYPEGNEVRYVYDRSGPRAAQRNLLEIRRVADAARGGGANLVTRFSYEPLFQRVSTITDPRGNAAGFSPPLGTASATRYTTQFFFDYQEGSDPVPEAVEFGINLTAVPRGLGDLNGDGVTAQVRGNIVLTAAPNVLLRAGSREALRLGTTSQTIVTQTQWNERGQPKKQIDPEGNVSTFEYFPQDDPDGDGASVVTLYKVLAGEGYLQASVVDAELSTRRTAAAPPVALRSELQYDPVGNVVATVNPRGVLTQVEVNQLNEPVAVTRGAGVGQAVSRGQLLTGEGAFRYLARTAYDHNGRPTRTELENRDGNTSGVGAFIERTFTYDILDNLLQATVEVDATRVLVTQFRYDANENRVLVVEPEGNQHQTAYDERDLPFTVTRGVGTSEASTRRIDYDRNANPKVLHDAEDNDGDGSPETTTLVYDGFDRLIETQDRLGNRAVSAYDVASNVIQTSVFGHKPGDPAGTKVLLRQARFGHDELRRVFRTDLDLFMADGSTTVRPPELQDQDSDGKVTGFVEFDALSRVTFTTEDDLETTRAIYDGASRVVETVDALGNRSLRSYDQNSNVVEARSVELSPEGLVPAETFVTRYVYDQLDRLVRATDNAGQTTRFGYDSRDNLVRRSDPVGTLTSDPLGLFPVAGTHGAGASQVNQPGNTRSWFFDGADRRVRVVCDLRVGGTGSGALDTSNPTNPDGQVSLSYVWDGNTRLVGRVDDNGNRTSWAYDALNRVRTKTNADLTTWAYTYDRDSNVRTVTDPNGSVVTKSYDVLDRLVRCQVVRAAGVGGTTEETFEYDGLSRQTKSVDNNGGTPQTCEKVWDSLSRLQEERFNGKAVSNVFTGDSKRVSCIYPGGRRIDHTFDGIDRVKTTQDASGVIATSFWIGPGQRELRRVHGNGTQLSFLNDAGDADVGYDAVQRVARLRHLSASGTAFVDRSYAYNRADVRTAEIRGDDGGQEDRYRYDSLYRLTQTLLDQGGTGTKRDLGQLDYRLDGVGNRRSVTSVRTSTGASSEAYLVNSMNEYTAKGGVQRAHSANGNLKDNGRFSFVFDYRNRLIGVFDKASGAPVSAYLYFADNRRARRVVFAAGGGTSREVVFLYDGWQVCEEQSGSGQTETTFVYSSSYLDEVIQVERSAAHPIGAGVLYLHQNARFDVVAVSDAAGAVVEKRFYGDFGESYDEQKQPADMVGSALGNPYGFQGRRLDPETGLYYYRNRYYDPETGRFVQRDPVWDPGNFGNQYSFVGTGPVSGRDPEGLSDEWRKLERQLDATEGDSKLRKRYLEALKKANQLGADVDELRLLMKDSAATRKKLSDAEEAIAARQRTLRDFQFLRDAGAPDPNDTLAVRNRLKGDIKRLGREAGKFRMGLNGTMSAMEEAVERIHQNPALLKQARQTGLLARYGRLATIVVIAGMALALGADSAEAGQMVGKVAAPESMASAGRGDSNAKFAGYAAWDVLSSIDLTSITGAAGVVADVTTQARGARSPTDIGAGGLLSPISSLAEIYYHAKNKLMDPDREKWEREKRAMQGAAWRFRQGGVNCH